MTTIVRTTSLLLSFACAMTACHQPEVPNLAASAAATANHGGAASQFVAVARPDVLSPATTCNFEQVDKKPLTGEPIPVKAGAEFLISGFFFSEASRSVPTKSRLRAISEDGTKTWDADVSGRYDRPDVPVYFHVGYWAQRSGFEQLVSSKALVPGIYHLLVLFEDKGQLYVCDNGRHLVVGP